MRKYKIILFGGCQVGGLDNQILTFDTKKDADNCVEVNMPQFLGDYKVVRYFKYKYHYLILKSGVEYETAQDTLMLHIKMNTICEMYGVSRMKNFKVIKQRISCDEWKRRYC